MRMLVELISGIAHNATNPTVLQSIAYFLSLADGTPFTSPPASPLRQYPRNSRPSSSRDSSSSLRRIAENTNFASDNENGSVSIQEGTSLSSESGFGTFWLVYGLLARQF